VTDPMEPAGQGVEQEAADELVSGDGHDLVPSGTGLAIILVAEGDSGLVEAEEASAMYESMSLPLGLPKYAENPGVQDLQSNLDRLFAVITGPK